MTAAHSASQRLDHANELVRVIAAHGRRFFYSAQRERCARVELDPRGRVWWVDDYTGKRIYTHQTPFGNKWRGFSHGGTLRSLAEAIRDYIVHGAPIPPWRIAPQQSYGDLWGYGEQGAKDVRAAAFALPIIAKLVDPPEVEMPGERAETAAQPLAGV